MINLSLTPQQLADLARNLSGQQKMAEACRLLTLAKRLHIAGKMQRGEKPVIYIAATSDDEKDEYMKFLWGDFWVQYELVKEFGALGYRVSKVKPDIIIHLYGHPMQLPQQTYNIAWIYSNPDTVRHVGELQQYDFVYVLSKSYQAKVREMGRDAEIMIGATSKTPFPTTDCKYPAVFVGNARRGKTMRPVVDCLAHCGYPFLVWGNGWEQFLPAERIGGRYFDNQRLDRLYALSEFSLNDHHADMGKYGFVAVKIFDILASGGFAISDRNHGVDEIFGETVPQFSNPEELQSIFAQFAPGRDRRENVRKKGQEIALSHTWADRAREFESTFTKQFAMQSLQPEIEQVARQYFNRPE
ncbi:glycosyltransferase [bacterium]|nr:glycosyltransferase [bacterium]